MRELILMKKDGEEINVPGEKLQEYLDDGWKEISRAPMAGFEDSGAVNKPLKTTAPAGGKEQPKGETKKQREAREKAEREAAAQNDSAEVDAGQESESKPDEESAG